MSGRLTPVFEYISGCGKYEERGGRRRHSEVQDLLSGKGHIAAVHLKETMPGSIQEIPYGEGHVNFREMIESSLVDRNPKIRDRILVQRKRTLEGRSGQCQSDNEGHSG